MKIVHKKDWAGHICEKLSQVDNVNRAGYVPLDIKYEEMRLAGIKLDNIRDFQYNYDFKSFIESGKSISDFTSDQTLRSRFNSKTELDILYKSKLEKLNTYNSNQERLKALHQEYLKEVELKNIREEAVKEFQKSLEKSKE